MPMLRNPSLGPVIVDKPELCNKTHAACALDINVLSSNVQQKGSRLGGWGSGGSGGQGVDAKSGRSVRKHSQSVGKAFAKRLQAPASVRECRVPLLAGNCSLKTRNLLDSKCFNNVNSHRDRVGPGRETQNCRHFWTRLLFSRLKSADSHTGSGGSWSRRLNSRRFWPRVSSSRFLPLRLKSVTPIECNVQFPPEGPEGMRK